MHFYEWSQTGVGAVQCGSVLPDPFSPCPHASWPCPCSCLPLLLVAGQSCAGGVPRQVCCSFCTAQQPCLLLLCRRCRFVFLHHFRTIREGLQIHSWLFVLPNELLQQEPRERLWSSEPVWVSDRRVVAGQFFCSYK